MMAISSAASSSISSTMAGTSRQPGEPRGAPAPLARDELEAAVAAWPHEDRLEDAVLADRGREVLEGLLVEVQARLVGVGVDAVDGDAVDLGDRAGLVRSQQVDDRGREPVALLRQALGGLASEIWSSQVRSPPAPARDTRPRRSDLLA